VSLSLAAATARLVDPLLAVVFPSSCPACGVSLAHPTRGPLCDGCWAALPRHQGTLCRCGLPLASGLVACGRCRRGLQMFAVGASLGPYEGSLKAAIHEFKYRSRRRVASRLAEELLTQDSVGEVLRGGEVLVPVPLHPRRHQERGFNQAALLALEIAQRTGITSAPGALVRRKDTKPQAGLSAAGRRLNVAGAFAVRRHTQIAGRVVVLVDDVLTTGATAQACARALKDGGAAEVRLLAAARVA
jgi:ComF family protein